MGGERKPDADGRPLKTRFERFWLQDGVAENRFPAAGYGREFTKDEINVLFADHTRGGGIDETAIGVVHGTHLVGRVQRAGSAVSWVQPITAKGSTTASSKRLSNGLHRLIARF